jgi:hypothetical protein
VYDPKQINDRLVLGLQGTMSEFELSLFRQRARQAFEQKVQRGHTMWEVPVGFVRTEDDRCEQIPDRQVQQAVAGVFRKFHALGSARQTALWYHDQNILLPQVQPGSSGHEITWAPATQSRVRQLLKNPCYAGALVYGRTTAKTVIAGGRPHHAGRCRMPQEQWRILLLDNHAGYISWEEYQRIQQVLETNGAMREGQTGSAAKGGSALLSGLVRCGRCGRQLFVQYSGATGRVPRYGCHGGRENRGSASCLSLGALRVDQAVVEEVLAAIQPTGVQASLLALEQLANGQFEKRDALTLTLQRARYEASRACRQYEAVDPENRLVAGELEKRWNTALLRVTELEQQLQAACNEALVVTAGQKERLLHLGQRLEDAWNHPAASAELKKRILRTVLREVVITNTQDKCAHVLVLHWQGGVHTELCVDRNRPGHHRRVTDVDVIELIQELSKVCIDSTIAATLNRLGYRTGTGKTWRAHSVSSLRYTHRLPNYTKAKDWLTVEQTADALAVSETVIRRLIKQRVLPAKQVVESTPWIIARQDLDLPRVQAEIQAVHKGRRLPTTSPDQGDFPWKQAVL